LLEKVWDDGRPQPFAALDRLGKAYLEFARAEPAYYSAMFEAGIPLATSPELRQAGERPLPYCAALPRCYVLKSRRSLGRQS
jgi:hypothetical protein